MLTTEKLRQYGANVDEGLQRCVNNEQLYLTLVNRFLNQNTFPDLKAAILDRDLEKAFHISNSLKGVIGNLSLSPLYGIIYQMTELLRNRTEMDYSDYIQRYEMSYSLFAALR